MSINPFTKRSIKKSSPIFKQLEDEGWIEESYEKGSLNNLITAQKISLKSHQEKVVEHFKKYRGLVAIHSIGSGKTFTSIAASVDYLKKDLLKRKVIVLCPASLEDNFRKELISYLEDISLIDNYNIMSYDKFSRNYDLYKDMKDYFLIVDEAHNLRTKIGASSGIKAKRVLEFSRNADKVLLLTATPFYNDPHDIVNLIAMVDNTKGIPSKDFFSAMISGSKSRVYFEKYFRNLISLYTPDSVSLKTNYPSHTVNQVNLKMSPKYLGIYELLEINSDITEMYYRNPNLFYNGLRQASNKIDDDMVSPKIEWVKKFLELHPGEKTLIFSNWVEAGIKHIKKASPEDSFLVIEGKTNKSERQKIVKEYNEDKDKNILIITKAGGEGLDLKNTRNVIILDPSWNNSVDDQVIGRAIRYQSHISLPEEERHVNIYQLYLLKPLEHRSFINNTSQKYSKLAYRSISKDKWSVDLYLKVLSKEKDQHLKDFVKTLVIPNSIEQNK